MEVGTWVHRVQLSAFRSTLTGGLQLHLAQNELLRDVFELGEAGDFAPERLTSLQKVSE